MNATATILPLIGAAGLGLRHALDPDHLVAVSTIASESSNPRPLRAARIGLAWGIGHGLSLSAAGLAAVLLGWSGVLAGLPMEKLVGATIALLGLRLLLLQRHAGAADHLARIGWGGTPRAALAMGLLHGLARSATVAVTLLPFVSDGLIVPAILVFAAMTCVAMIGCAAAMGSVLGPLGTFQRFRRRFATVIGVMSLAFGITYFSTA